MVNVSHQKKLLLILIQFCIFIIYFNSVAATGYNYTPAPESDYLVNNWEDLPFKDQRGIESWSININDIYLPDRSWDTDFSDNTDDNISFKCLSYAASTVNDWFNIQYGLPMENYTSIIRGTQEQGTNPRELESQYQYRTEEWYDSRYAYTPWYSSILGVYLGPITNERIPYRLRGYAHILSSPENNWINHADLKLDNSSEFNYTIFQDYYNIEEYKEVPIDLESFRGIDDINEIISALENYGPLLAYTEQPNKFINIHSMALIGYGEDGNGTKYFIAHDNYGESQPNDPDYSTYKKLYIEDIDQAFKFYPKPDWPTFHHDYRRTGSTLLKGDMDSVNDVKEKYVLLETNGDTDAVARSSVADIDNDDKQDTVTVVSHVQEEGRNSTVYDTEYERPWQYLWLAKRMNVKWEFPVDDSLVLGAPNIADVDGDTDDWQDEVLIGLENGSIQVIDFDDGEDASEKWQYNASTVSGLQGKVNSVSAYDLDLDGTKEIAYVDYVSSSANTWGARLYVLEDDGSSYDFIDDITVSNGGAAGDLSIADVDGDDYPEIVVPTFYGVKVYNLTNDVLYLEWSAPYGLIEGDVVIYDINRDNNYELIFTTNNITCEQGSCTESIIVLNGSDSGNLITNKSTSTYGLSRTTPAIADIDGDGNPNIIITSRESSDPSNLDGHILSYEYSTTSNSISDDWQFPLASGVLKTSRLSPSIADIDGDNEYEVVFAENNEKQLYVLQPNGQILFNYTLEGLVGSAPALADVNDDDKIDIVVKRAGSPYSILSVISINNTQPEFVYQIPNISATEGDLIDINESGLLRSYDEDGDEISITYSALFNDSGLWQTDNNSSGNYSVLIEIADQNLSNYMYVDVFVFDESSLLINSFNDSTTNQSFNFSSTPQNYTKYIRVPQNMSVLYAELRYEAGSP